MARNTNDSSSPTARTDCLRAAREAVKRRDFERAEEQLRRALALDEEQPAAHNLRGVIHDMRGQRLEAQNSYRKALNLDAMYEPARFNLRQSVEPHGRRSFMLTELKRSAGGDLSGEERAE